MAHDTATQDIVQDLGDGLIMRTATLADAEPLARSQATHQADPPATFDDMIYAWMLELLSGDHPTFQPSDFLVVEDTANGEIASSLCLISQEWLYEGIPFKVGQPELVSTHPDYRRRGLVRKQFEVIHRWSEERGELVQAIGGIPWYYRQFGYEMALAMGGGRAGYTAHVPKLGEGETEPYNFRRAAEDDIPFVQQMLQQMSRRYEVTAARDERQLRHEMKERKAPTAISKVLCVIETPQNEPIGILVHDQKLWGTRIGAHVFELKPGVSWAAVTPAVVRYLSATGAEYATQQQAEWNAYLLNLGTDHPSYHTLSDRLPRTLKPYAWYMRVPDLPAFVRHITPAIDRRLQGSVVDGHTGELQLNFYRSGISLQFEGGRLVKVEPWRSERTGDGNAGFPDLTFLQLLFGYRSLEELEYAFPDCWVRGDEYRALLNTIFPKRPSAVWQMG